MSKQRTCKTFTREFKLEVVRLIETSDCPSSEIAMALRIRRNQLYQGYLDRIKYYVSRISGKVVEPLHGAVNFHWEGGPICFSLVLRMSWCARRNT